MPLLTSLLLAAAALTQPAPGVLDDFADAASWRVITADGVSCKTGAEPGRDGPCLRIDYDFAMGSGYCIIQKPFNLTLPPAPDDRGVGNYEFTFDIRGEGPSNSLEFKLLDTHNNPAADADTSDVWWVNRRDFTWPGDWTTLVNRRRHMAFAWGPSGGTPTRKVDKIEFAIAATSGGHGTVWLDNLRFRPLPEPLNTPYAPSVTASSNQADAAKAGDTDTATTWRPAPEDEHPSLTLDLAQLREFGGLVVDFPAPQAHSPAMQIERSDDAAHWAPLASTARGPRTKVFLPLPDSQARFIRVTFPRPSADRCAVADISIRPTEFADTLNSFYSHVAAESPRGLYPQYFLGKQTCWTVVGNPDSPHEALLSEHGTLEVAREQFSIEPFVFADHRLYTWADAEHTQSLEEGFLPIPTVTRDHAGLRLAVTAFAGKDGGADAARLRYSLTNTRRKPVTGSLFLAARPFQVNPPWQSLKSTGGFAPISRIEMQSDGMLVNGVRVRSFNLEGEGAASSAEGDITDTLNAGQLPGGTRIEDPGGRASCGIRFDFNLAPGETRTQWVSIGEGRETDGRAALAAAREHWSDLLATPDIRLPASARRIEDSIRTTIAYILINADGPAIQPGSRAYERSWIRDGSLTSAALLSLGHTDLPLRFLDWYAANIYDNGKVPCVVDARGPDPVPENDADGEYLFAVANAYRFTHDRSILDRHWPHVQRVVAHIQALREQRLTPDFDSDRPYRPQPGKPGVPARAFRGLMPESISHEGYSAKPMHSYWDDIWTLRGLTDAAFIAHETGSPTIAAQYERIRDDFRESLVNSIKLAMTAHHIDYIPGCVELGDFDSTSTTIACFPGDAGSWAPPAPLTATFDRYWSLAERRMSADAAWDAFTPYELRHVGAFIRRGQPDRANALLGFFLSCQRPAAWNEWAEVVWHDPATPKFIGDMPHTWCGSDFLNSFRAMLVYENEPDQSLRVFAGIPEPWLDDPGAAVAFNRLPTWYGPISGVLAARDGAVTITLSGNATPPGGIFVRPPRHAAPASITIDRAPVSLTPEGLVKVPHLPATIVLTDSPR